MRLTRGSHRRAYAGSVTPVVDRRAIDPSLPPVLVQVESGFNCVVIATIGGKKFRATLDSGASRSVIRTSFAEQLRANKVTKGDAYGPRPLSRAIVMEGFMAGSLSQELDMATQVKLGFTDVTTANEEKFEVCFAECADSADAMLIAFPDLARMGYAIEDDDDGYIWITLRKLGVTLQAEVPDRDKREGLSRATLKAVEPRVITGPAVEMIDAWCGEAAGKRWVCDDEWPGVRVIEGPLVEGASQIAVAVEAGQRAIICGGRVPWRVAAYTGAQSSRRNSGVSKRASRLIRPAIS